MEGLAQTTISPMSLPFLTWLVFSLSSCMETFYGQLIFEDVCVGDLRIPEPFTVWWTVVVSCSVMFLFILPISAQCHLVEPCFFIPQLIFQHAIALNGYLS